MIEFLSNHIVEVIIYYVCIVLAGIFWGEYQTIIFTQRGMTTFKAWFGGWWSKINMPKSKVWRWLVRYPLAWFRDGFHNVPFVSITLLVYPLMLFVLGDWLNALIIYIVCMAVFGFWANVSLHDWFTKIFRRS